MFLVILFNANIKNSASGARFYPPHLAYDSLHHGSQTGSQLPLQPPIQGILGVSSPGLKKPDREVDLSPSSGSETKNSSTHNMQDILWCLPRLRNRVTHIMHAGITDMSQVWETKQNLCFWNPAEGKFTINTWKWQDTVTQRCSMFTVTARPVITQSLYTVI